CPLMPTTLTLNAESSSNWHHRPHISLSTSPQSERPLKRLSVSRYPVRLDRGSFQVLEVRVMRKKHRSFLLMALLSASLLVSMFTIAQAQNSGATAAKATKWSDPATWPNRKVPVAGDKVIIEKDKQVVLDVTPPALNGVTIDGKLSFVNNKDVELTTEW